jgi:NAD(P)-dependent dehydrogenase (short-subunit alcohol dehydrogenase family)
MSTDSANLRYPFRLDGQLALVTGGFSGLGLGIARCLAAQGAQVVITTRRPEVHSESIDSLGATAYIVIADVTSSADRNRLYTEIKNQFSRPVSILVNNAGNHMKKPASEVSDEDFHNLMNTHLNTSFALARDLAPQMREAGHGSIVNLASMASYLGLPGIVGYTCAKTAVVGLTRSLAAEWAKDGIRVNAVAPGWISSPMTEAALGADPARKTKVIGRIMTGEMGHAEDVGWAVAYLCSPAARYITGTVLPVDGGASVGF